jgi:hypothetical protein
MSLEEQLRACVSDDQIHHSEELVEKALYWFVERLPVL